MAAIDRTIYVLRYKGAEFGEASTLDSLQTVYDSLTQSIIENIRKQRLKNTRCSITDAEVILKYVDKNGVYIFDEMLPTRMAVLALQNKHADFLQYFSSYGRDLYTDRETNSEMAHTLFNAIKKRKDLEDTIVRFQKGWFREQLERSGGGVLITKYPTCNEDAELSALNENVTEVLHILGRISSV
jgi:hypothetical protein